jgi:fructuronate reductase
MPLSRLTRSPESVAKAGIVHIGIGAFHRGHQAWYTHKVMQQQSGDWGIIGVSLRSDNVAKQLNPQNGLYTLVQQDERHLKAELITSISHVLVAPESPLTVLQALSDASIKVVTLTITEKGYCHKPASGQLNFEHPDIQHDLANSTEPKTAIGFLVYAMKYRIENNIAPFTVLSCDNLPANGLLLQNLILSFAERISSRLADTIQNQYCFPCSMVDRIVPAMEEQKRGAFCQVLEHDDQALVITEPFSQWVIEDNFVHGRPAWEQAGALLVGSVHCYESMKLQLLNGSHSAIAYIGYLSGFTTVSEAVSNQYFRQYIHELMLKELMPSLTIPNEINVYEYCEQLLSRFANIRLHHETRQIAMDGSQKLPQRWFKAFAYQIQHGLVCERLSFAIANWIYYTSGKDLQGEPIEVQDPIADSLRACVQTNISSWANAIVSLPNLFGETLADNTAVIDSIVYWLSKLVDVKSPMELLDEVQNKANT